MRLAALLLVGLLSRSPAAAAPLEVAIRPSRVGGRLLISITNAGAVPIGVLLPRPDVFVKSLAPFFELRAFDVRGQELLLPDIRRASPPLALGCGGMHAEPPFEHRVLRPRQQVIRRVSLPYFYTRQALARCTADRHGTLTCGAAPSWSAATALQLTYDVRRGDATAAHLPRVVSSARAASGWRAGREPPPRSSDVAWFIADHHVH